MSCVVVWASVISASSRWQGYLLNRFYTKLLRLASSIMTVTGRVQAECRVAFLRLYLQELQQELAERGCGYYTPNEVAYRLLWGNTIEAEQHVEEIKRGMIVPLHQSSHEQHWA